MPVIERFFILTPTPTDRKRKLDDIPGTTQEVPIYLDAQGDEYLWTGASPLPAIGDKINLRINNIGNAKVVGYHTSNEWLGIMAQPDNPPDFIKKHTKEAQDDPNAPKWRKEGICCAFGIEVGPAKTPRPATARTMAQTLRGLKKDTKAAAKEAIEWLERNPDIQLTDRCVWDKCQILAKKHDVRPDIIDELITTHYGITQKQIDAYQKSKNVGHLMENSAEKALS